MIPNQSNKRSMVQWYLVFPGLGFQIQLRVCSSIKWRHDTQHDDTRHNDTRHNDTGHIDTRHYDTRHNDIRHNSRALLCWISQVKSLFRMLLCWVSLCWVPWRLVKRLGYTKTFFLFIKTLQLILDWQAAVVQLVEQATSDRTFECSNPTAAGI